MSKGTGLKIPVCELPVMKGHCASCPFKPDERGIFQDVQTANKVIERTLFKGQQICHGTEKGNNRTPTHRCKGSYDFNKTIYERMGLDHLLK